MAIMLPDWARTDEGIRHFVDLQKTINYTVKKHIAELEAKNSKTTETSVKSSPTTE